MGLYRITGQVLLEGDVRVDIPDGFLVEADSRGQAGTVARVILKTIGVGPCRFLVDVKEETSPPKPRTIGTMLIDYGCPEDCLWALGSARDWSVGSGSGMAAGELCVKARALLDAADPAAHEKLWDGIVKAISILCYG